MVKSSHYALPLSFEVNRGQADSSIGFLGRGSGLSVAFRKNEADFLFARQVVSDSDALRWVSDHRTEPVTADSLHMRLLGANASARIEGVEPLPGTANYFVGNDPTRWRTAIPTFSRVRYSKVYPGIDLEYYGAQQRLEFDFRLAPGADPATIRFRLNGARKLTLDGQGNLIVRTRGGPITFHVPTIYQPDDQGNKHSVAGSFRISASRMVSFSLGNYDHAKPLVIDPVLNYSALLAPVGEGAVAMAVDKAGSVYVTGVAFYGFPITAGAYQSTVPNDPQKGYPYVAKLNSTGTALLYSTYLMGTGGDAPNAIAIDASGNAYIAGFTSSTDFPVTSGAFQTTNPTTGSTYGQDAGSGFVAKLNSTGTGLIYSSYLGGNTSDYITGITVDASGSAYVTGNTMDSDFPTTAGAFQPVPPVPPTPANQSGFVTKFNPTGTALAYSTYLSGGNGDWPAAIALDTVGEAYVVGWTASPAFPITPNAIQPTMLTTEAAFVTKLNSDGNGLAYSTFLGGSSLHFTYLSAIAVDASGDAYVGGITGAADYPVTPGALFQPNGEHILSKLNGSGTALVYSARFGGTGGEGDSVNAIAVDSKDDAFIVGCSGEFDYPVTPGALETQNVALFDDGQFGGFVSEIDPSGATLLYSTYFGGTGDQVDSTNADCPTQIALGPAGNVYVAGLAVSPDFPITPGVIGNNSSGGDFIAELNASEMTSLPLTTLNVTSSVPTMEYGQSVTFTAAVQPTSGQTPTGSVGFSFQGLQGADAAEGTGVGFGPWTWLPLDSNGTTTLTMNAGMQHLPYNEIKFEAQYLGDANNAPSYTTYTEPVTQIPTTIICTSSQNPAVYGSPVVFTATVLDNTGKPAVGAVVLSVGDVTYATSLILDSNGQVSWTNGTGGMTLPNGAVSVQVLFVSGVGYATSSTMVSQTFTPLGATPSFSLTGAAITIAQGATTGNTSAITVTPNYGFTGTVTLSATIASSPSGAVDPPTLSFGATSPVNITGANPGKAVLTISTSASSSSTAAQNRRHENRWLIRGGSALACCLIFGVSSRRRRWQSTTRLTALFVVLLCGVQACGGMGGGSQRNPGTTPGSYTITVTGSSGALQQTTTFAVTVD